MDIVVPFLLDCLAWHVLPLPIIIPHARVVQSDRLFTKLEPWIRRSAFWHFRCLFVPVDVIPKPHKVVTMYLISMVSSSAGPIQSDFILGHHVFTEDFGDSYVTETFYSHGRNSLSCAKDLRENAVEDRICHMHRTMQQSILVASCIVGFPLSTGTSRGWPADPAFKEPL